MAKNSSKSKKRNSYAQKAKKKHILNHLTDTLSTKGDIKNTLLETGKDLVICVLGGGLLGAAVGKPSLLIGLGLTGTGHYMGSKMISLVGLGMMAANGFQKQSSVNGVDGFDMESIKERLETYKNNFAGKLYLDKLLNKQNTESTNGFGDLQFFNYPNDVNGAYDELSGELSALDRIERQIDESGMEQMRINGVGDIGEVGIVDVSDLNL